MVDNNLIVARLLRRGEYGRMTVCLSRVSFMLREEERMEGDDDAPLSIVSEDCIRLTEREELFPGLRLFVHIWVKLLAQLQSQKNLYKVDFA
jgi:hypothetical protein